MVVDIPAIQSRSSMEVRELQVDLKNEEADFF